MIQMLSKPYEIAIFMVPSVSAGAVVGSVIAITGLALWLAVATAVVVMLSVAVWTWRRLQRMILKAMRAQPLVMDAPLLADVPLLSVKRYENIVKNLCITYGMPAPKLHIVGADTVDIAALGLNGRSTHLVITKGALIKLHPLEMEAAVARGISELRSDVHTVTVLAGMALIPGVRFWLVDVIQKFVKDKVLSQAAIIDKDIESARLTSYPPALITALQVSAAALAESSASEPKPLVNRMQSHAFCMTSFLWLLASERKTSLLPDYVNVENRMSVLAEL